MIIKLSIFPIKIFYIKNIRNIVTYNIKLIQLC